MRKVREVRKVKFHSKALDEEFEVSRIIGEFHGDDDGPVLVFFGGVHGNEPAGVIALMRVMEELRQLKPKIRGSIYAIAGNMSALAKGIRFDSLDLNRIWTKDQVKKLKSGDLDKSELNLDELEQLELFEIGELIFSKHAHQVYCIDMHTTSAETVPFITMNDTLINRRFSNKFPVPVVLGIEEYLNGPLLNWIIEIGYPCIAFEAGTHDAEISISNHESFIWLSLVYGGLIGQSVLKNYYEHLIRLGDANPEQHKVFEIWFKKEIEPEEQFAMKPGYHNFRFLSTGETIASSSVDGDIQVKEDCRIFMPLYQGKGDDGFFLIRKISPFWLRLSASLRKMKVEGLLTLLPGVNRDPKESYTLVVNRKVARFLATEIFHLLGYRSKQHGPEELRFSKREYDVRGVAKYQ